MLAKTSANPVDFSVRSGGALGNLGIKLSEAAFYRSLSPCRQRTAVLELGRSK